MKLAAGKQIQILTKLLQADTEQISQLTATQLGATTRVLEWFADNTKAGQCLHIFTQGSRSFYRLRAGYAAIAETYLKELTAQPEIPLSERLKTLESLAIQLPASVIHKRIAAALLQQHSKETLNTASLNFIAENKLQVQHDALLRLRSITRLTLKFACGRVEEIVPEASINKELILTDLALSTITQISTADGSELKLVTIENHAAFCHFALQTNEVTVFQPGFDDRQVSVLLQKLDFHSRSHFGDLDQQGIEIAMRHIPQHSTPVELLLPKQALLVALLPYFALPVLNNDDAESIRKEWRPVLFPSDLQEYLMPLISTKQWLEQEVFTLLPRESLFALTLSDVKTEPLSLHVED